MLPKVVFLFEKDPYIQENGESDCLFDARSGAVLIGRRMAVA
jgi:hypothetical protein